jgi:multidrug efflux pump subunit AcrA (membrane-fusion protein)
MSSGQSTEPIVEPSQSEPEVGGPPPPPRPEPLRELQAFLLGLLQSQCALVGAAGGAVFLSTGGGRAPTLLVQHQAADEAVPLLVPAVLSRMERLALEVFTPQTDQRAQGRAELIPLPRTAAMYGEEARQKIVASPLWADGRVEGACVLALRARDGMGEADALKLLSLSAAQFEAFLWRRQCLSEAQQKLMLRETLELLDVSQQGASAGTMGAIMCNELKRRFGCTRVSIGLVQRDFIRLAAVTGADEIDRNAPAVECIEEAMEECAAQDVEIVYPPPATAEADPSQRRVTRAHEDLSRKFGPAAILSLPLRVEGDLVGVVALERDAADPFPAGALPLLRLVAETIGPALWTRRLADRGVLAVTRDRLLDLGTAIVGPRHTAAKLLGLVIMLALIGTLIPVPSRVTASAEVRAAVTRTIVPPFTGYIESVSVQPGDNVEEGQLLASMDTADMVLELAESQAKIDSFRGQYDEALQKGDNGKARSLEAQEAEETAHLNLLKDHIARAQVRSPVAGVVGKGDLRQFVQAKVDPTQPLFEVVSREQRAVAFIEERDVQRVKPNQPGSLVSRSRPGANVPVKVTRVNPAAEVVRGKNVYQAELEIVGPLDPDAGEWLRPGMTGTVKLEEEHWRPTLVTVLGPIVDEVRMRMWW